MQSVDDVAVAENISMSHDVLLPDTIEPQVCDYWHCMLHATDCSPVAETSFLVEPCSVW